MSPTPYPLVNQILERLLREMRAVLGSKLVGVYLYGSLVTGDFDLDISDIDLMALVATEIDAVEFVALQQMYDRLSADLPAWHDRIETAYLSVAGLKHFRTRSSRMGNISPGEPFHILDAGADWLMNWYNVRTTGIALSGPPPAEVIDPIAPEDYVQAVREHVAGWQPWLEHAHARPAQAYIILTMCRALYTCRHGHSTSKRQAALWAKNELPAWASTIDNALRWRISWREPVADPEATRPETIRFVEFITALILADKTKG